MDSVSQKNERNKASVVVTSDKLKHAFWEAQMNMMGTGFELWNKPTS